MEYIGSKDSAGFASLPQEMVEEIAARLPVKSLMKFKCVSKSWLYMIESDRRFMDKHLRNSENDRSGFIVDAGNDSGLKQLSVPPDLNNGKSTQTEASPIDDEANNALLIVDGRGIVVGCCNGLLCIFRPPSKSFFLWNPATRVTVELPNIGLTQEETTQKWGFGFDQQSDSYKVFALVADREKARGVVYSTKSKSWRTMEGFGGMPSLLLCRVGKYGGGRVYWLAKDGRSFDYLDLKNEVFGTIQISHGVCHRFSDIYGCLLLICYNEDTKKCSLCVMVECGVKELCTETTAYQPENMDPPSCCNGAFFFFETLVSPNY